MHDPHLPSQNCEHARASTHAHHDHGHHGHAHHHQPAKFDRAFAVGIALNAGFVLVEAGYGFFANSLALMADAVHNLSDVLSLLLAWGASWLVRRAPTRDFTYGLRSTSILASLANALLLMFVTGGIVWEAVLRLQQPVLPGGWEIVVVALIGVVINGGTAAMFMRGSKHDLNLKGAYLHMAADAGISVGVALSGLLVIWTGWRWLDPAVSLAIALVILVSGWGLLRESVRMALHAVPENINLDAVRGFLAQIDGVTGVHDFHVWPMSTTETALTAHLERPEGSPDDSVLRQISDHLASLGIAHMTLQFERGSDGGLCRLSSPEAV